MARTLSKISIICSQSLEKNLMCDKTFIQSGKSQDTQGTFHKEEAKSYSHLFYIGGLCSC